MRRHTAVSDGDRATRYAHEQRLWVSGRGQTVKELDAFEDGIRQGYLKALVDLEEQGFQFDQRRTHSCP